MKRFLAVLLAIASWAIPVWAQKTPEVKMELRSATGSNRFQLGQMIPLELVFSSTVQNKYLEPCLFLNRSCFGYPVCRFANQWKFSITPGQGWVDFDHSCAMTSGPTFVIKDHDLSPQPKIIPYELTTRYRFDAPGKYTVRFSLDIGLDDESNPRPDMSMQPKQRAERHSVNLSSELQLEIVPADTKWQKEMIRRGYEAYSRPAPPQTNPPSPELVRYREDTIGLCELGTPEASRVLVGLLLSGSDVTSCLNRSPSTAASIEEMERLLTESDAAISNQFLQELLILLNHENRTPSGFASIRQSDVDLERERLVAALPHKRGNALSISLFTVLQNPPTSKPKPYEVRYPLRFPDPVIALAAANFADFPEESQEWLLKDGWDGIRSPLMSPTVRSLAERGFGPALLRWQELDPVRAEIFEREEVVRPIPRFSSFYLRLTEPLLPEQEKRLAANFVDLAQRVEFGRSNAMHDDLVRLATLLHRYGTGSVLSTVLPVIDAHRSSWPCAIEFPVLAYLLKVSPDDAAPRMEAAVREANHGPCNTSTFFTDLGFLQPGSVMERLAFAQLADVPGPFARDAADYLRRYAAANSKQRVWERLEHWQKASTKIVKTVDQRNLTYEEQNIQSIARSLVEAYIRAQGWLVTAEDESRLKSLLGGQAMEGLVCMFDCRGTLGVAGPANFAIYESATDRNFGAPPIMDYLNRQNPHRYSIRQYGCPSMPALKEKLLQFPSGSSFDFAWDFSERDRDELVEISDFLWSHGYKVRNPQNWSFLRPTPPR